MIENVIFWAFAAIAVFSALGVVFHRSIVYSALLLVAVFLSIAAFFILNNADFLAIAQTIVYGVGLTIILLFGVMFTGDKPFTDKLVPKGRLLAYGLVSIFALLLLSRAAVAVFPDPSSIHPIEILSTQGSTGLLGDLLFTRYLLPFELASILLLVAMIGAIVLSKRKFTTDADVRGLTSFDIDKESHPTEEAAELWEKARTLTAPKNLKASQKSSEETAGVN